MGSRLVYIREERVSSAGRELRRCLTGRAAIKELFGKAPEVASPASLCWSLREESLERRLCWRRRDRNLAARSWMVEPLAPSLFALRKACLASFLSRVTSFRALLCCLSFDLDWFWDREGALVPNRAARMSYTPAQRQVFLSSAEMA